MEIVLRSGETSQHQGDDELTRFQTCVGRCLSSFTPPLKVLTSCQGIGFAHFRTGLINDLEFSKVGQTFCPSSLTPVECH